MFKRSFLISLAYVSVLYGLGFVGGYLLHDMRPSVTFGITAILIVVTSFPFIVIVPHYFPDDKRMTREEKAIHRKETIQENVGNRFAKAIRAEIKEKAEVLGLSVSDKVVDGIRYIRLLKCVRTVEQALLTVSVGHHIELTLNDTGVWQMSELNDEYKIQVLLGVCSNFIVNLSAGK